MIRSEIIEDFNGTFQPDFHSDTVNKYTLPKGWTIEQNLFYPASWSLLCNGKFVFHGNEEDCFIAFGGHLSGVGK